MKKKMLVLGLAAFGFAASALVAQPVLAETIVWQGNGTDFTGVCNKLIVDPTVTGQNWLFVLNSANKSALYHQLRADFDEPTGDIASTPSKVNNQVVQFSVNTAPYALLEYAEADNGTAKSVLTVSHCEVGVISQWCSPGYWRNAEDKAWADAGFSKVISYYNDSFTTPLAGNPTLYEVLQSPQTYGGAAFNNVGDLLSAAHPYVTFVDGVRTPDSCPIDHFGFLID